MHAAVELARQQRTRRRLRLQLDGGVGNTDLVEGFGLPGRIGQISRQHLQLVRQVGGTREAAQDVGIVADRQRCSPDFLGHAALQVFDAVALEPALHESATERPGRSDAIARQTDAPLAKTNVDENLSGAKGRRLDVQQGSVGESHECHAEILDRAARDDFAGDSEGGVGPRQCRRRRRSRQGRFVGIGQRRGDGGLASGQRDRAADEYQRPCT